MPEAADLTAVIVEAESLDEEEVRKLVLDRGYGDGWLRVAPLAGLGLTQVEVLDAGGLPHVDPALVEVLSRGRKATFVHVNHEAKQALVHCFVEGRQALEGWVGDPSLLDEKLGATVGRRLATLIGGDDGTRGAFGAAASHTTALSRRRALAVPVGTPTALGSFAFHDRGGPAGGDDGAYRVALIAVDAEAVRRAWESVPGAELAARIFTLAPPLVGPLRGVRDVAAATLAALGDRTPAEAGLRSVIAYELATLTEAYLFGGGESTGFVDARLLPMFSIGSGDPQIDDADEAEELESRASVLEAMCEVLPYTSPEGAMLEQIADEELSPLAPWAAAGDEYVGSVFRLAGDRIARLLVETDSRELAAKVDRFYRGWWRTQVDAPFGDEFEAWRRALDEKGRADIERFLTAWAEWRTVLTLAARNQLQPALVFYGIEAA